MFNVGGGEILVILLLALLVLGPDKLPEYARKAGRYMNEFRRMTSGFQEEFRQAMDLSDTGTAATADDALDRTTEGPRLLPQTPMPTVPSTPPEAPGGRAEEGPSGPSATADPAASSEAADGPTAVTPPTPVPPVAPTPPAPTYGAAFAADVTPAPGSGPELVVPPRPDAEGDSDSSSAA